MLGPHGRLLTRADRGVLRGPERLILASGQGRRTGRGRANLLVGQSGGATAVINASLAGVVEAALADEGVGEVIGMRRGVEGLLREEFVDLRRQPPGTFDLLRRTPSAALGSCRHKLGDDGLDRALAILRRHDVRYLLYIGGNDSADTAHRLHDFAASRGYDLRVLAVPKTIDNDL